MGRTIRSTASVSSAGPFTATGAAASNLSVGSGVSSSSPLWAHLTASAPFRAGHQARYPAGYPRPPVGGLALRVGFPLPFGHRHSLLGHPVPAKPGLPYGRLTGATGPDLDGVSVFRTHELRPGWVPSVPRGRRCSSRSGRLSDRRPPHLSGMSLHPANHPTDKDLALRGINQGFKPFARPVFPSPVAARMERSALGFPPGFAPRRPRANNARQGGDRPSSTDLELQAQLTFR